MDTGYQGELKEGTLWIKPLERLAAARQLLTEMDKFQMQKEVNTIVIRVDNASACECINMGREQ